MAHYAKVKDGVVTQVIVAEPEFFDTFVDTEPGEWVQTSYNTFGGKHYTEDEDGVRTESADQSKALRKNYAGVGYIYDAVKDAFYAPQPYDSWTLDEDSCLWEAPIAYPSDEFVYEWNEESGVWEQMSEEDSSVYPNEGGN